MRLGYDVWYRFGTPPWVGDARSELVELVGSGVLAPGRAIDLGCGVGDNAIFLARHGFEVTGSTSPRRRSPGRAPRRGRPVSKWTSSSTI
jgi:SAM-dependent methyltransferase